MHPVIVIYLVGFPIAWIINIAIDQYMHTPKTEGDYLSSASIGFLGAMLWPILFIGYLFSKLTNLLFGRFIND